MIKAITLQFADDESQMMIGYSKPKTDREAIDDAKRLIRQERSMTVTGSSRCGSDSEVFALFTRHNVTTPFAWVTLQK